MKTEVKIDEDHTLVFTTNRIETMAVCEGAGYEKRVAWHKPKRGQSTAYLHGAVEHLFPQYIEDVKRHI